MNGLEIEVKFFVTRPEALRARILALGGVCRGRVFERNEIFDDPKGSLKSRGELLRLRQDTCCRLTYKHPAASAGDQFKILCEKETVVADADVLQAVFRALGLRRVLIYEKWRETFGLEAAHLCLDQLPFGSFLEIEGDRETIRRLARALDFSWPRRIIMNYHQIFTIVAEQADLPFTDITFENFQGRQIDPQPYRHRFEEGTP